MVCLPSILALSLLLTCPQGPADGLEERLEAAQELISSHAEAPKIATALHAVGNLKNDAAADALAELIPDLNDVARYAAIQALGMCATDSAIVHLREIIEESRQMPDRETSARVLASTGDTEWLQKYFKKEKNSQMQAGILAALIEEEVEGLEKTILKAVRHKNGAVRAIALHGVWKFELSEAAKLAEKALKDSNLEVKMAAVRACGVIGSHSAFRQVISILKDTSNPTLRSACGEALKLAKGEKEIELIVSATMKERDTETLVILADALASAAKHHPETATKALLKLISSPAEEVRLHIIRGLANARPDGVLELLVEQLEDGDPTIRNEAAWALGELGGFEPDLEEKLVHLTQDKHTNVRINSTRALAACPTDAALEAVIGRLGDRFWAVRSAAVETLGRMRRTESLVFLVDVMEKDDSRVCEEIAEVLAQLTGEDFAQQAGTWRRWIEDQGADYQLPSQEDALATLTAKREKQKATESDSIYHGITLHAGVSCFIMDVSGSMNELHNGTSSAGVTRYTNFANALKKAIGNLPGRSKFNIVLFSSSPTTWRPASVHPTEDYVEAACDFLDGTSPFGGTNIYDALFAALEVEDVQNIYLLTDGEPTVGFTNIDGIISNITRINRDRRVNIHTIAAGDAEADFLADLAAANGGEAVDLRELP
ncbi:MAG: HEAT repeat domain-containing protein [Planctomycetes bacterium]|nr:HEAT repeat domain-containing protein [Planctomycetota bacterium]